MERVEVILDSINQHILNDNPHIQNQLNSEQHIANSSTSISAYGDLWPNVLKQISAKIDQQLYKAWIAPLKLLSVDASSDQQLVKINLEVSSKFSKEHISREYGQIFSDSIKSVYKCLKAEIEFFIVQKESKTEIAPKAIKKELQKKDNSNLNPNYNFSNYVVGACNKLAHTACIKVSEELGSAYNPLFLYGGVGLGKTHLVNAIGNAAIRRNKKVLLASSEMFVSELVSSLRTNSMDKFKSKFRNIDLLIVDDIQFIIGKNRTQEEFFHTFNELFNNQKQIVITSDRIPQELTQLDDRLRTRFSSGLYVDLQKPDLETRIKIFNKKAELLNLLVPDECTKLICEKVNSNIRELEGVINRLKAFASINNQRIDLPVVINILDKIAPNSVTEVNSDIIQEAVSSRFGVSVSDINGKRRTQNIATARQLSMYLCREITNLSYPEIGALFGGRDHSTVIHAYKVVTEKINKNEAFKAEVSDIRSLIVGR